MLVKHIVIVLTIAVTGCAAPHSPDAGFGDFPITSKGCGATVLRITGKDTEHALAIGKTTKRDAIECCERDSGGITIPNGGPLTVQQCIDATLKAEGEAKHSSSADCPRKRVMTNWVWSLRDD